MPGKFTIKKLSRWRWNVLDLIQICNRGSVPTYLFADIDMGWTEQFRAEQAKLGRKMTVTAIMLKAIALAQLKHPDTRTAMLPWGRIVTFDEIVASFTVEKVIEGEPAVYFGAITDPDKKSIFQIGNELKEHAELDVQKIQQLDLEHRFAKMPWLLRRVVLWIGLRYPAIRLQCLGATFGLSSLGKYAIRNMIPPCVCAATFGIGALEKRPVVRNDEIVIRPMISITLNFDHRLIDGAPAARFLQDVRDLLEGGLAEHLSAEDLLPLRDRVISSARQITQAVMGEPNPAPVTGS